MVSSIATGSKKYNFLTTGNITAINKLTIGAPLKRMYTDDIVSQHIGSSFAGHSSGGQSTFKLIGVGIWHAGAKVLNINNTAGNQSYIPKIILQMYMEGPLILLIMAMCFIRVDILKMVLLSLRWLLLEGCFSITASWLQMRRLPISYLTRI
jgi:hypothetical protein